MGGERERAVEVLCREDLAGIVDLVAYPEGEGADRSVVVANAYGASRLRPGAPAEVLSGRDPVAHQDPMARSTYEDVVADPWPSNAGHSYPLAAERLHSLFADPRAPDVAVVHTPRHYFPERGGHLGEHGSLNVTQSRAPLILSGAGVEARGILDDWARVVDVAPTLARLAGVAPEALGGLDGRARDDLAAPGAARVVGLLWDGAVSTDLLHLSGVGALPNVARLLGTGVALRGGAVAEFPSVTLCNHTSALTGVGPGRHGVVGNVFVEPETDRRVLTNDATAWHRTATWLRPGVRTVFEEIASARPAAPTACVNEPVDRGASYSTMALVRARAGGTGSGALESLLPDPRASALASQRYVRDSPRYARWTAVDDAGLEQVLRRFARPAEAPALTWWNTTVIDAGNHAGGPRSPIATAALVDSDRRLGVFLDHLDAVGMLEDTVVLLTADHGFEAADPDCRGDWGGALAGAGLGVRDEGSGFLYLRAG